MEKITWLKGAIEALLFTSPSPLSLKKLREILGVDGTEIRDILKTLEREYAEKGRGILLREVGGGFKIFVRREYGDLVKKLGKKRKRKLSPSTLETLTIIAYRQPITREEIEKIRGVNVRDSLRTLRKLKLIRVVGRKKVPGRPYLYGTTKEFLLHLGIKSLRELPKPEDFKNE